MLSQSATSPPPPVLRVHHRRGEADPAQVTFARSNRPGLVGPSPPANFLRHQLSPPMHLAKWAHSGRLNQSVGEEGAERCFAAAAVTGSPLPCYRSGLIKPGPFWCAPPPCKAGLKTSSISHLVMGVGEDRSVVCVTAVVTS